MQLVFRRCLRYAVFCYKISNSVINPQVTDYTVYGEWLVHWKTFAAIKVCDLQPLTKFTQLMAHKHQWIYSIQSAIMIA